MRSDFFQCMSSITDTGIHVWLHEPYFGVTSEYENGGLPNQTLLHTYSVLSSFSNRCSPVSIGHRDGTRTQRVQHFRLWVTIVMVLELLESWNSKNVLCCHDYYSFSNSEWNRAAVFFPNTKTLDLLRWPISIPFSLCISQSIARRYSNCCGFLHLLLHLLI